jgi:hypothetical protein
MKNFQRAGKIAGAISVLALCLIGFVSCGGKSDSNSKESERFKNMVISLDDQGNIQMKSVNGRKVEGSCIPLPSNEGCAPTKTGQTTDQVRTLAASASSVVQHNGRCYLFYVSKIDSTLKFKEVPCP